MKSYDYYAITCDEEVYCKECAPHDDVYPIFANSEWDHIPACAKCGQEHDYVVLL